MRQSQLPFAAQNHPAQRAVNVQQPRQVRRAHVVRVQEMLQGVQRGDFGRVELRVANISGTMSAAVMVGEMSAMFCASSSMKFRQLARGLFIINISLRF